VEQQVVFYRLQSKIVNQRESVPNDARQVVYYSLAIGHHIGVMDCFSELVAVPLERYRAWLGLLPEGGARRKLAGALRWQEIEINRDHLGDLLPAMDALASGMNEVDAQSLNAVTSCMRDMLAEPALYLMVRMRA
jgi:hydrogenase-4 component J